MLTLNREKLEGILRQKGLNIQSVAKKSAVSRQSLYQMFRGGPVFNTPFLKIASFLGVEPEELLKEKSRLDSILGRAPSRIQKAILKLINFCDKHRASLVLFGSQGRGTATAGSDWDFGIYFHAKERDSQLRSIKRDIEETVFPYRIDVTNLNRAPQWFLKGIIREGILLHGKELPLKTPEAA